MKFICPQCETKEEIMGDDAPLCWRCKVPMIKATLDYANLIINPCHVLRRFETVMRARGLEEAKRGRHKKEREAWITAVWAFGLREITGQEYWIEIETREQTPDCKVHFFDQSKGHNHQMILNVEVVEWDEHRADVMELIEKKCTRAYPPYFFLLVFARNGENIDVPAVLRQLRELTVPFGEIWILGRLSNASTKYGIFRLHPAQKLVEFDLIEAVRKDNARSIFCRF